MPGLKSLAQKLFYEIVALAWVSSYDMRKMVLFMLLPILLETGSYVLFIFKSIGVRQSAKVLFDEVEKIRQILYKNRCARAHVLNPAAPYPALIFVLLAPQAQDKGLVVGFLPDMNAP